MGIEALLSKTEYKFLEDKRKDIELLAVVGSRAYGTHTETSDMDTKGIRESTRAELLNYVEDKSYSNTDVDLLLYPLHRVLEGFKTGNPTIMELLGGRNEDYLILGEIGAELLAHKDDYVTKNLSSTYGHMGYNQILKLSKLEVRDREDKAKFKLSIQANLDKFIITQAKYYPKIKEIGMHVDDDLNVSFDCTRVGIVDLEEMHSIVSEVKNAKKLILENKKKVTYDGARLNKYAMHCFRVLRTGKRILQEGVFYNALESEDLKFLKEVKEHYTDDREYYKRKVTEELKELQRLGATSKIKSKVDITKHKELGVKLSTAMWDRNIKRGY